MKKKKKNKNLFTKTNRIKPEKKTKRVKETSRLSKKAKSPFKIVIRNWENPLVEHKELELNEDSRLEIHIDNNIYSVGINKKNKCLQFDTHETHLYLQPTSVHSFLVKANSPKK